MKDPVEGALLLLALAAIVLMFVSVALHLHHLLDVYGIRGADRMSDIDALAEGLAETRRTGHFHFRKSPTGAAVDATPADLAQALAATFPVAELLRLAAIGRAVERLPEGWSLTHHGDGWWVHDDADIRKAAKEPGPTAAIENALEDE